KGSPVFWSTFWVSRAFRMPGRWPVNSTSTTAPMTWAILPWPATATGAAAGAAFLAAGFLAAGFLGAEVAVIGVYPCRMSAVSGSERFSAGDDLDQLGGDLGLAGTVVLQRQGADEVAGVARGVVHRSHLGAEEAGLVFQKGGQDLRRQVARQQGLEDVLFRRLVLIERAGVGRGVGVDFGRGQLTRRRDLRDHRLELAVEERDLVGLVRLELFSQQFGDRLGRVQAHRLVLAQLESLDDLVSEQAGQLVARLAADSDDLDVLAVGDQAVDVIARSADDVGREPARQTLVGRGDDDQVLLVGAGSGHQARAVVADASRQVGDDRGHPRRIGAGVLRLLLGALQLGRRDHLHGFRDLLRRFDASDPIAPFLEASHPALLFL